MQITYRLAPRRDAWQVCVIALIRFNPVEHLSVLPRSPIDDAAILPESLEALESLHDEIKPFWVDGLLG